MQALRNTPNAVETIKLLHGRYKTVLIQCESAAQALQNATNVLKPCKHMETEKTLPEHFGKTCTGAAKHRKYNESVNTPLRRSCEKRCTCAAKHCNCHEIVKTD